MTTPLQIAVKQIGYQERGSNITKFWAAEMPSYQGGPWCMAFVVNCFREAGLTPFDELEDTVRYHCEYLRKFAERKGWTLDVRETPQPGDIVIYDFGGGIGRHTGIVERNIGSCIIAIEGNTSGGSRGSQDNGDGVYRRIRSKQGVMCYIRVPGVSKPEPIKGTLTVDGTLNEDTVIVLQKWLSLSDKVKIAIDGQFGPSTQAALAWMVGIEKGEGQTAFIRKLETYFKSPLTGGTTMGRTVVRAMQRYLNNEIREGKLK